MHRTTRSRFLAVAVALMLILSLSASVVSSQGPAVPAQHQDLYNLIQAQGALPIFVGLNASQGIAAAQSSVLAQLSSYNVTVRRVYNNIPYFSAIVDLNAFTFLANNATVTSLQEVGLRRADLANSIPIIGADVVHGWGFDGTGQVVAILDTGVDGPHPYFQGRVVGALEGCFSTEGNVSGYDSYTLCPNDLDVMTGPGAAMPYANGVCQAGECDHGTHVAGIAAGYPGVAPGADIMAVQVFSWITGFGSGAWDDDIVAGMDWVATNAGSYNIASVNLSLGGGSYSAPCPGDVQAFDDAAALLSGTYGTATVTSSGNEYSSDAMGWPACSPEAISVGSTNDNDNVDSYSNAAYFLDFLAPGSGILSSIPGGGTATYSGTSMASPHVAGTYALLRDVDEAATLTEIYDALDTTGVPVYDSRNGMTFPRIQVDDAALTFLGTTLLPGWYEEDAAILAVGYNAYWSFQAKAAASGGGAVKAQAGAELAFTFEGDLLTIYRRVGPTEGMMQVCVDDVCQLIDNYAAALEWTVPVTVGPFAPMAAPPAPGANYSGEHTVEISRPADQNAFWLDAFEIMDMPTEVSALSTGVMYNENAANFMYRGGYVTKTKAAAIGGSVYKFTDWYTGVYFHFTGTEFTFYSRFSATEGAVMVCVDGWCVPVSLNTSDWGVASKVWGYDAWVRIASLSNETHYVGLYRLPGNKFFFDGVWAGTGAPVSAQGVGMTVDWASGATTFHAPAAPDAGAPAAAPAQPDGAASSSGRSLN